MILFDESVKEGEVYRISGLTGTVFYATDEQQYQEAVEYFRSRGSGYSVQRIDEKEFYDAYAG